MTTPQPPRAPQAAAQRGNRLRRDPGAAPRTHPVFHGLTVRGWFRVVFAMLAVLAVAAAAAVVRGNVDDWTFWIVVAGFGFVAAALTLVLNRTVVGPLNRLRVATRRVVDGDFGHRIEITGPSDLRAVSADVEAMRSELVTTLNEAKAAKDDLDAQAAELMRSNAELEQFAYVASHDLQEPLRKVASFCQLLEKRYGDQLDERGRQYIDFAVDGAKRLQVLINDLLTFSRVGRGSEVSVRLSLDGPLDDAIGALGAAIEESGMAIERPSRLPDVIGDATLLGMLWQNLLSNAVKFRSPDRKPVLRITVEPVTGEPGERWLFCIDDNGIGIPPEFAEKVFVIFQRLHGRDAYPGTGIGLALCRRIVEQHGGQISVDADTAEGTRICFTLPLIQTAQPDQTGGGSAETTLSTEGSPA